MKNYTQFVQELNEMFPGSKEYIAKFGKSQIKWSDDKEEKKPEADGEAAPKRGRGRPKGSYGSYKSHPENKGKYKGVHAARKAKVQEALEYMATLDESEYDAFLQSLDEELFSDLVEALDEEGVLSLEEQDIDEAKRTEVRDPKTGKVVKWKEEGDWHKSTGDVVDKSGAKHGAYSKVRDLARKGIKKVTQEELEAMSAEEFDALVEDFEQLDELSKKTLASYVGKAAKDVAAKHGQHGAAAAKAFPSPLDHSSHLDDANKRKVNIHKAIDRLAKPAKRDPYKVNTLPATGAEVKKSVDAAARFSNHAGYAPAFGSEVAGDHAKDMTKLHRDHMAKVLKGTRKLAKEELETPVDVYTNFITEHKGA